MTRTWQALQHHLRYNGSSFCPVHLLRVTSLLPCGGQVLSCYRPAAGAGVGGLVLSAPEAVAVALPCKIIRMSGLSDHVGPRGSFPRSFRRVLLMQPVPSSSGWRVGGLAYAVSSLLHLTTPAQGILWLDGEGCKLQQSSRLGSSMPCTLAVVQASTCTSGLSNIRPVKTMPP